MKLYELLERNSTNLFQIKEFIQEGEVVFNVTKPLLGCQITDKEEYYDLTLREVDFFHASVINGKLIISVVLEEVKTNECPFIEETKDLLHEIALDKIILVKR